VTTNLALRLTARQKCINSPRACHIGSQLTSIDPFIDATDRLLALIDDLKAQGINIRHLDVGGGLGVVYRDELPPQPSDYAKALLG